MKKNNKKGFTLAELLIVVAIIAVLVAVAIPVFRGQLEKAQIATDEANIRSAYGEAVAAYLGDPTTSSGTVTINGSNVAWAAAGDDVSVTVGSAIFKSNKYQTAAGATGYVYAGTSLGQ